MTSLINNSCDRPPLSFTRPSTTLTKRRPGNEAMPVPLHRNVTEYSSHYHCLLAVCMNFTACMVVTL